MTSWRHGVPVPVHRDVPLVFTCTAMPPWPGDDEALLVDGPWTPLVDVEPLGASS